VHSATVTHNEHTRYVAAVMASLEDIEAERERLLLALGAGVVAALGRDSAVGSWGGKRFAR
jgi:hypothetical protein